eukprot:scaffold71672_cov63-Phaeocystis_antarctica.AAC.3
MLRCLRNTRGACEKAESARNLGRTAMRVRVHAGVAKAAFGAGGAWSLARTRRVSVLSLCAVSLCDPLVAVSHSRASLMQKLAEAATKTPKEVKSNSRATTQRRPAGGAVGARIPHERFC